MGRGKEETFLPSVLLPLWQGAHTVSPSSRPPPSKVELELPVEVSEELSNSWKYLWK